MSEKKKCYISIAVCCVLMFVWIFVCMALTGGRETTEFTPTDDRIFAGFLIVEGVTLVVLCVYLVRLVRDSVRETRARIQQMKAQTEQESKDRPSPMGAVLLILAVVLSMAASVAGIWCRVHLHLPQAAGWGLFLGGLAVPALCALAAVPLKKAYGKKWNAQSVQETRDRLWSYRESEDIADKMLKKIRCIRRCTDLYAVVLGLCGLASAFGAGLVNDVTENGALSLLGGAVMLAAMSQLRFPRKAEAFEPQAECYLPPERYPELYALARKAAATQRYRGKIKLFIVPGCNAGIAIPQRTVLIQVGVILLNVLSQEELYQVLLHEFGHCAGQRRTRKERLYWNWLLNGGTPVMVSRLVRPLFSYPIGVYVSEYQLYDYAAAVQEEQAADAAVCRFGNAEATASELIKIGCYDMYQWEDATADFDNIYAGAQPCNLASKEIREFRAAMENRSEVWVDLLKKEILSKAATHPTLRMRLEAMRVTDWQMRTYTDSDAWVQERTQATQQLDQLVQREYEAHFEENRKEYYLEPLKTVEEWEAKGCPVMAEEYADVVSALRAIGRVSEAMALCDRAIAELPEPAAREACYLKGCGLLHRFDPAGLDLIYHAMDNNNNFVEEGLEIIGTFCCMTGQQEELERYREKAVELQQRAKDTYDRTDELNPGDQLSEEHLPEGMLEGILTFVQSVDGGQVRQVYLVRKTAGEDFFASAVVLRFADDTSDEVRYEVLHKMFRYLDTSTDWYFTLFDYDNVRTVDFAAVPGSCVLDRTKVEQ